MLSRALLIVFLHASVRSFEFHLHLLLDRLDLFLLFLNFGLLLQLEVDQQLFQLSWSLSTKVFLLRRGKSFLHNVNSGRFFVAVGTTETSRDRVQSTQHNAQISNSGLSVENFLFSDSFLLVSSFSSVVFGACSSFSFFNFSLSLSN